MGAKLEPLATGQHLHCPPGDGQQVSLGGGGRGNFARQRHIATRQRLQQRVGRQRRCELGRPQRQRRVLDGEFEWRQDTFGAKTERIEQFEAALGVACLGEFAGQPPGEFTRGPLGRHVDESGEPGIEHAILVVRTALPQQVAQQIGNIGVEQLRGIHGARSGCRVRQS